MTPFDFTCPTRIVFGPGRIAELGALVRSLGEVRRALVVSDPGIVKAGHTQRGLESLRTAGFEAQVFDGVAENPTTAHVERGVQFARDFRPEVIVPVGGGSSMDCAKGINFIYSCGGRMQDYWGVGKATGPLLPMVAVPTTSGTGSETQSFALISDADTHVKMACGDKRAAFRVTLLDPELTMTQPPRVTALTAIDAISHAVETFVTLKRSDLSLAFSRQAWRLLAPALPRVIADPHDKLARADMQLGACFAGLAIENSMLGAAHALANPLTAEFDIAHGEAVGLMLPHVVRHNGLHAPGANVAYNELQMQIDDRECSPHEAPQRLAELLSDIRRAAGLAGTLKELNIPADSLPRLAAAATQQWTGGFNPVKLSQADFQTLYEAAYV